MKHMHILSKAAQGDSATSVPTVTDVLFSIISVIASMANVLLLRKNMPPLTTV